MPRQMYLFSAASCGFSCVRCMFSASSPCAAEAASCFRFRRRRTQRDLIVMAGNNMDYLPTRWP